MPNPISRSQIGYYLLITLLACAFLFGGSARDDVRSLILFRPISAMLFSGALFLAWQTGVIYANRALLLIAVAIPVLALVQLIPLPPPVWSGLPGRDLIWRIGEIAQIEQPWRPLSVVPYRTWNSFWATLAPLAALLLGLCYSRERSYQVVLALAVFILASVLLSLLQVIGAPGNRFYLYAVTNPDAAVGLFANRNHQAMLLAIAFPVFAAAASISKGARETAAPKRQLAIGLGVLMLPFILVTGSRAGLLLVVIGAALALWVYRNPAQFAPSRRKKMKPSLMWGAVAGFAICIVGATAIAARAAALDRLFAKDTIADLRFEVTAPIWRAALHYFPAGSGLGTFVEVYKVVEPDRLLSPRYLNHAHNDWLEVLLTAGLPGLLICAAAIWLLGRAAIGVVRERVEAPTFDTVTARLGLAIVVILALGSAYDYPLRTPSLACLFAVAVAWLAGRVDRQSTSRV